MRSFVAASADWAFGIASRAWSGLTGHEAGCGRALTPSNEIVFIFATMRTDRH